jgi:transposase-like protein
MNFKNLTECLDFFKEEEVCIAYLEHQRWGGTPACPFCGVINPYRTNRGFKCRDNGCGKKFTVKVGTIYENSKIPLRTWFAAGYICLSSKKGVSSLQISRQLGITQKTAWFVLHRLREMLRDKAPQMLRGTTQIDETYVGGKIGNKHKSKQAKARTERGGKGLQGRSDTKTPVFGISETGGKVIVKVTNWVTKKSAQELIEKNVAEGSTMVTDGFAMYAFLGQDDKFKHVMVDHKAGQYVNGGFHTNGIENFWSLLKRGIIGIFHQVSPQHLQRYCDEFAARYNTRKIKDYERFDLYQQRVNGRLTYAQLIGNGKETGGTLPQMMEE